LMIGVVTMAVGMGTYAYFSDTETSADNTFTAGTLDLTVNNENPLTSKLFDFSNVKPGDNGSITVNVCNNGTIDGGLVMCIKNLTNYENGCTEPEGLIDTTCDNPGPGQGELGANLVVNITWDGCPTHTETLDSWSSGSWHCIDGIDVDAGTCRYLCTIDWEVPSDVDNIIQSDSVEFDLEFVLKQELAG